MCLEDYKYIHASFDNFSTILPRRRQLVPLVNKHEVQNYYRGTNVASESIIFTSEQNISTSYDNNDETVYIFQNSLYVELSNQNRLGQKLYKCEPKNYLKKNTTQSYTPTHQNVPATAVPISLLETEAEISSTKTLSFSNQSDLPDVLENGSVNSFPSSSISTYTSSSFPTLQEESFPPSKEIILPVEKPKQCASSSSSSTSTEQNPSVLNNDSRNSSYSSSTPTESRIPQSKHRAFSSSSTSIEQNISDHPSVINNGSRNSSYSSSTPTESRIPQSKQCASSSSSSTSTEQNISDHPSVLNNDSRNSSYSSSTPTESRIPQSKHTAFSSSSTSIEKNISDHPSVINNGSRNSSYSSSTPTESRIPQSKQCASSSSSSTSTEQNISDHPSVLNNGSRNSSLNNCSPISTEASIPFVSNVSKMSLETVSPIRNRSLNIISEKYPLVYNLKNANTSKHQNILSSKNILNSTKSMSSSVASLSEYFPDTIVDATDEILNSSKSLLVLEQETSIEVEGSSYRPNLNKTATDTQLHLNVDSLPLLVRSLSESHINSSRTATDITATDTSISEYIPDKAVNVTDENVTTLEIASGAEQETSVELIENPIKLSNVKVPHKNSRTKQHFCIFCKSLKTKLPRHFILKHKTEQKVKEALCYPTNSKERLKILEDLRKQGNFLHNTSEEHNTGILIVSRQQQAKYKNNANDYICCKNCKGFFSKKTLRIHLRKCGTETNSRHNFVNGRKLTQFIHPCANLTMRTKVFPVMRDDEITRVVVIKWGNWMTEKYTLVHQHDMIRARLRLLARFLIEVKQLDSTVKELKDIYKPCLFDTCVEALRKVAKWDEVLMWFKTPANAQSLTSLIKKCGARLRSEYIKNGLETQKSQLTNFLLLWEEEVPVSINKKANDDQNNKKRDKKEKIPTTSDIKKLYSYLKTKITKAMNELKDKLNQHYWDELIKATLIYVMIFNRRRAGELERVKIKNYLNQGDVTENIGKELLQAMSEDDTLSTQHFSHLFIRGKRGRSVGLILDPLSKSAIDIILKYRAQAGIEESNGYIFSRKASSKFAKPYYRACPLLKQYALECGAEFPETLRGTFLRKHLATYISLRDNVEDAAVDQLANFMGHNKDIHKNVYRVPVPVAEVTRVSKLLMLAIGECDEEEESESDEDDGSDFIASKKKRRSTSPFGKTKRVKWSQEEREAISSTFGALGELKKLPSNTECLNAIKNNTALKKRTPLQIKAWIDNQRRYKLKVTK